MRFVRKGEGDYGEKDLWKRVSFESGMMYGKSDDDEMVNERLDDSDRDSHRQVGEVLYLCRLHSALELYGRCAL